MKYYVYILYSESKDRYYKGSTSNIAERIERHNNGSEIATAWGVPWVLVWNTEKSSRSEAMKLEKKLKNLSRERTMAFVKKYKEGLNETNVVVVKLLSPSSS